MQEFDSFNSRPRTEGIVTTLPGMWRDICFNSRPRTEGICGMSALEGKEKFQFSPSHRGHLSSRPPTCDTKWFQFSPSHRGHPQSSAKQSRIDGFQFSPSHRGHRFCMSRNMPFDGSFNSRPRTEGISDCPFPIKQFGVSILALAQRASRVEDSTTSPDMFQFSPSHRGHPFFNITD